MKTSHVVLAILAAVLLGVTAQPFPVLPLLFFVLLVFKLAAIKKYEFGAKLEISWVAVLAPLWIPIAVNVVMQHIVQTVGGALLPQIMQLLQALKGPAV